MSDVLRLVLTPAQLDEWQIHFIEDTAVPKGKLLGNVLHITKEQARQTARFIKSDYDINYGLEHVSASRKKSMLKLGEKLKELSEK